MMSRRQTLTLLVVLLDSLLLGFAAGVAAASRLLPPTADRYPLVSEAKSGLAEYSLEPLPSNLALQRGMVAGMVDSLGDPYTIYLAPPARAAETDTLNGEYGDIGTGVMRGADGAIYLIPFPGGPAEQAGVKKGDRLLQVDQLQIGAEASIGDVEASLQGIVGSDVTLKLMTPGDQAPHELRIVRAAFSLPSLAWYPLPGQPSIGVVTISWFSDRTAEEVGRAFEALQAQGVRGYILDLRGNGGGLLTSAVDTARSFLASGTIAYEQRKGERETQYTVNEPGRLAGKPLAVIVDGSTASAAELLAAALQQNGRAQLVGQSTYGKGTVQAVVPLSDGSSLHVTTAAWLTPDHTRLGPGGLMPDIVIGGDPVASNDPELAAAAGLLMQRIGVAP
jgi:carboxyl-terminal processing protease